MYTSVLFAEEQDLTQERKHTSLAYTYYSIISPHFILFNWYFLQWQSFSDLHMSFYLYYAFSTFNGPFQSIVFVLLS